MPIYLRVQRGMSAGEVFALESGPTLIGRATYHPVVLDDEKVSATHSRIDVDDDGALLTDLGSTNGTHVNGQLISGPVRLEAGDTIRVGNTVFVYGDGALPDAVPQKKVRVVFEIDESRAVIPVAWANVETELLPKATPDIAADELRHLYDVLAALYRITGLVSRPTTLDDLLAGVLDVVFELLPADHASILFAERPSPAEAGLRPPREGGGPDADLVPRAARCAEATDHTVAISETICREVVARGRGVLTRDASEDDRFRTGDSIQLFGIRSAMCVPIRTPRQLLGVIYLDTRSPDHHFTERDLDLLNAVGSEVGLAVENLRLVEHNLEAERLAATGEAVAGLSHYIRNILQSIEAARALLDAAIQDDDKAGLAEAWGALDQNIELISELVLNMLSYSRRPEPTYQVCSPNELARRMAELVAPRAGKRGTRVELDLDPDVPSAMLDPAAIHRALLNLLNNAIDATGQGTVRLATRFDPERRLVRFAVSDQGPGIPEGQRDAIFQAFFTTKGAQGTGLGLAVTRKLVEQLGGHIEVDSAPGQGATLTIALPEGPPDDEVAP